MIIKLRKIKVLDRGWTIITLDNAIWLYWQINLYIFYCHYSLPQILISYQWNLTLWLKCSIRWNKGTLIFDGFTIKLRFINSQMHSCLQRYRIWLDQCWIRVDSIQTSTWLESLRNQVEKVSIRPYTNS